MRGWPVGGLDICGLRMGCSNALLTLSNVRASYKYQYQYHQERYGTGNQLELERLYGSVATSLNLPPRSRASGFSTLWKTEMPRPVSDRQLCAIARAELAHWAMDDSEWRERIKCRIVTLGFTYPRPEVISAAMTRVEYALAHEGRRRSMPLVRRWI